MSFLFECMKILIVGSVGLMGTMTAGYCFYRIVAAII